MLSLAVSRTLPPLTWFRSFEAAARTLSFTAAAEEIGLTQSAISQQVKSLEQRLGVALFVRRPRGLSLTDEGRKLLPQVSASLDTLTQAARSLGVSANPDVLTVAMSVSVAQWLITPHLNRFVQAHPNIRLRVLSAVWPDDFNPSRAYVNIQFGPQHQTGAGARLLEPNDLVPLRAPSMTGDISELPLIETVGTSGGWSAWQAKHGPLSQPTLLTDTYGMALEMAAHGSGVALVSEVLATHAIRSGRLVRANTGTIAGSEGYYLSCKNNHALAHQFEEWLLALLSAESRG